MTKLEPTEAQRELMIQAILDNSGFGPKSAAHIVDAQIAAANSIPEGPPVGTIARRADGGNIAIREYDGEEPYWVYLYGKHWDTADSWPVIYDPDEYHEGDKPRLERLMREPSVFNSEADEVEELAKWLSIHIGTWPEDEWELRSKPNYYHDRARELLDLGYRKVSDPTAQQEPGESLSRGLDDIAAGRVSRRDDYLEPQQEPEHPGPPSNAHIEFSKPARTPRVLPSLDCEEARDGTVWSIVVTYMGTKCLFQYRSGMWHTRLDLLHKQWRPCRSFGDGPWTEVLGDPS